MTDSELCRHYRVNVITWKSLKNPAKTGFDRSFSNSDKTRTVMPRPQNCMHTCNSIIDV